MATQRKTILLALAVLAGALVLRLVHADRGMWGDEITTYWVAGLSTSQIVEERLTHNHLPTYFLFMHVWTELAGSNKLTLRLPSILTGAAAVATLFLILTHRFPLGMALLASTLFGLNAAHLFISQSSRMYGPISLLTVLFFGCFLKDFAKPSRKNWVLYTMVVLVGCSIHPLFLLLAMVAAGMVLWEYRNRARSVRSPQQRTAGAQRFPPLQAGTSIPSPAAQPSLAWRLLRYVCPFAVGAALFVGLAKESRFTGFGGQEENLAWLDYSSAPLPLKLGDTSAPRRRVVDPSRTMIRTVLGDFMHWKYLRTGWPKNLTRVLLWTVAGLAMWSVFRVLRPEEGQLSDAQRQALRLAVLWILLPPLTVLALQVCIPGVPALQVRHLADVSAAWALVLAFLIWRLRSRRLFTGGAVGVSLCFAIGWLRYAGDGLPETYAHWQKLATPGDTVFFTHRGYWEKGLQAERIAVRTDVLRAGTSFDCSGSELAAQIKATAQEGGTLWLLHYFSPSEKSLQEAFSVLEPDWTSDLVYRLNACAAYRLAHRTEPPGG